MAFTYSIVAKVESKEIQLEKGIATEEAAFKLAEDYATGREAAWTEHYPQAGQIQRIFYPVHKLVSVYVIPQEKKE
jgi:hypothetical protein